MAITNDISAKHLGSNLPDNSQSDSIGLSFVAATGYDPKDKKANNEELEEFMRAEMESGNFACDNLETILRASANMAEICYHECSLPEKQNIALYTWYGIYVDDMVHKDPSSYSIFEQRFLSGQRQLNPILDAFAQCASMHLGNISCMEPQIEKLPLVRGAHRFSWFVRHRGGAGSAYALMSFMKFHKENLEGETANYIHTRAYIDNKAPLQVLAEIAEELRTAINTIHLALSDSPRALHTWEVFEHGYITWHITQVRYKLKDLDLE
ncbi:hypothetical protein JB92DRAFT_3078677 [Gautieria morchelliformis]|nr:hypothetical protein JB92DRAFT_3078677 [Gautieria morchelliformis]